MVIKTKIQFFGTHVPEHYDMVIKMINTFFFLEHMFLNIMIPVENGGWTDGQDKVCYKLILTTRTI